MKVMSMQTAVLQNATLYSLVEDYFPSTAEFEI
jgi:hypothetical protein